MSMGFQEITGQVSQLKAASVTKCLQCVIDMLHAKKKMPDTESLPVNDAITWAPMWIPNTVMGQTMMACVVVPCCIDHLEAKEKTPEQIAMEGGIMLGGGG